MSESEFDWIKILVDSSKNLIEFSIELVKKQPELFDSLLYLIINHSDDKFYKSSQRAARVVYYLIERNLIERNLIENNKYLDKILDFLEILQDDSIRFSLLKIFTVCSLPKDEDKLSLLTKICYDALESQTKRIAVKIYSIEILYRISEIYPELKHELRSILEIYMIDAQPAFINRAEKLISKLGF